MKKTTYLPMILMLAVAMLFSCKGKETPGDNSNDDVEKHEKENGGEKDEEVKSGAKLTCIFTNVPAWKTPSTKNWKSSINLGETMTYLGETKVDTTSDKNSEYYHVELADGEEAWVNTYHVIIESKPAVAIREAAIYQRPDLMTITDKKMEEMTIVAVKDTKDEWSKVVYPNLSTWGKSDVWVKTDDLSENKKDIGTASVYHKIMNNKKDGKSTVEKLEEIIDMTDGYSGSAFDGLLEEKLNEAHDQVDEEPEEGEE